MQTGSKPEGKGNIPARAPRPPHYLHHNHGIKCARSVFTRMRTTVSRHLVREKERKLYSRWLPASTLLFSPPNSPQTPRSHNPRPFTVRFQHPAALAAVLISHLVRHLPPLPAAVFYDTELSWPLSRLAWHCAPPNKTVGQVTRIPAP